MLETQTGKGRAQRIELDYYKQPTASLRWKRYGSLVALVIAVIVAAAALLPAGRMAANTGTLSRAHGALADECQACHTPLQPIASDAFLADSTAHLATVRQKCEECHPSQIDLATQRLVSRQADVNQRSLVAVPAAGHFDHLLNARGTAAAGCVQCHREHQGGEFDLTRVENSQCTDCHRDLEPVTRSREWNEAATQITSFSLEGHPEFSYARSGASDPGTLYFDHRQHLLPGQVEPEMGGGFTEDMLPSQFTGRYEVAEGGLLQLKCEDCHVPAGPNQTAVDLQQQRTFAPVDYEQHCSACHELNFPLRNDALQPIPHASSWPTVAGLLRGLIAGQLLESPNQAAGETVPAIPGTRLARERENEELTKLEPLLTEALVSLRDDCTLCHTEDAISDEAIDRAHRGRGEPLVPTQWLTGGSFNHAAHRQLDCRGCHQAAYPQQPPGDPPLPPDDELIMIAGIESCVECHRAPERSQVSSTQRSDSKSPMYVGWASDSCTTCHRYHWTPVDDAPEMTAASETDAAGDGRTEEVE